MSGPDSLGEMMRVLFVCHGNTCRSPAAQALVRHACPHIETDSAGVSADRVTAPPTPAMRALVEAEGVDMSDLQARQITPGDFTDFDLIIAMDHDVLAQLKTLRPIGATAKMAGFMDYMPGAIVSEIADPWHTGDYPTAFELIQQAADAFVDALKDQPRQ